MKFSKEIEATLTWYSISRQSRKDIIEMLIAEGIKRKTEQYLQEVKDKMEGKSDAKENS